MLTASERTCALAVTPISLPESDTLLWDDGAPSSSSGSISSSGGLLSRRFSRLEVSSHRCLLVFDNATEPGLLRPFIPATGAARVIVTSNQQSVANLGTGLLWNCSPSWMGLTLPISAGQVTQPRGGGGE